MTWLSKLVVGVTLFISSLFGASFAQPAPHVVTPMIQSATSTQSMKKPAQAILNLPSLQVSAPHSSEWLPISDATSSLEYKLRNGVVYDVATLTPVKGANPSTFELAIDPNEYPYEFPYAKDEKYVYCNDSVLAGADPATFSFIFGQWSIASGDYQFQYGKDQNHVYSDCKIIQGADPSTFQLFLDKLGNYTEYAKDKNTAYFDDSPIVIPSTATTSSSTSSFVGLSGWPGYYATDDMHVFAAGKIIPGADPATFSVLLEANGSDSVFAKDKNHAYVDGQMLSGVDLSTFHIATDSQKDYSYCAEDSSRVYVDTIDWSLLGDDNSNLLNGGAVPAECFVTKGDI
jgi:hypothetical protein